MGLFTETIDLKMADSKSNIIEKYEQDVHKKNVIINVAPGYKALINGGITVTSGESEPFKRTGPGGLGDRVVAFVYLQSQITRPLVIPFFAGQHTISLDANKTAKVKFALVGEATVEISDMKAVIKYFDGTVSYRDAEKEVMDKLQKELSSLMAAAAKGFINSSSTDVSIYADLKDIAKAGLSNSTLRQLCMDMGVTMTSSGISLRLNPVGNSSEIIDKINDKFNEQAMESFQEDKKREEKQWEREEKLIDNQHEIDVINANNSRTENKNNSNTYNYNGNTPPAQHHHHDGDAPRAERARYCASCGHEIGPKDAYCPMCGAAVKK